MTPAGPAPPRYESYCLRCDLAGRPAYTARTNATSHAMPAAQGYIAREAAFRGIPTD